MDDRRQIPLDVLVAWVFGPRDEPAPEPVPPAYGSGWVRPCVNCQGDGSDPADGSTCPVCQGHGWERNA